MYIYIKTLGLCNTDTKAGIFRKKSNTSRSRLSINQGSSNRQTSSCPTSPRQGLRLNSSTSSLTQYEQNAVVTSAALHRSASTMSSLRPRSSPSGLFSYTGNYKTKYARMPANGYETFEHEISQKLNNETKFAVDR